MANAIVTLRIMPESPDTDLKAIEHKTLRMIEEFAGKGDTRVTYVPIAFGLKALDIIFIMDENMGSPEALEQQIKVIEGVNSIEVTDVRRAIG